MSASPAAGNLPERGLQAERTILSWSRTSFAFVANGAVLMIKNLHGSVGPAGLIPAILAGAVALGTYAIAFQRQRTLQQHPTPTRINPRRQVYILGIACLALIVVTTVALLLK